MPETEPHPYRDTKAAKMLSAGLARASADRGVSLRQVGKLLGYRQAVVLSHMATGRVPIPIDRADQLAAQLELDPIAFTRAVLEQRHPDVAWALVFDGDAGSDPTELAEALEVIARKPLDELSAEQKLVLREVVADPSPRRRWLSVHEVAAVDLLRRLVPHIASEGISRADARSLERALGRQSGAA